MQKISNFKDTLGFLAECRRTARGMCISVFGVVAIKEYSGEIITLATHSGAVSLFGESLSMSVFANQSAEIFGKIRRIEFGYGKN
jgi:hypothetical protein